MKQGLIIKGVGGFYDVKTADGIYRTRGRGALKREGFTLAVGDMVEIEVLPDETGVISSVFARKNHFIRPPIANVDTFIVVCAAKAPKPNFSVIDRFLIMAELHHMQPVICVNKCDMADGKTLEEIKSVYEGVYPLVFVSGKTGEGIEELYPYFTGKRAAFAGPSGVGKSTITNRIIPEANMKTGGVSKKTARGKHTTRHVEIFETPQGGMIFDTPGFTSFEILEADEENLSSCYPEIAELADACRFDNCRHDKEPGCAVRAAESEGKIHPLRYASYLANLQEIRGRKKY